MKYRYIYIEKIGRFYFKAKAGYSFGSTLHQALQTFHQGGAQLNAEELTQQVETKWISAGYDSPQQEQEYREQGAVIIQEYHAKAVERVESGVITLFTEKSISTDMGKFVLSGRVDRIDQHPDGKLEIIDYKSGRTEVTEQQVAGSLAMQIYQLILSKNYPGQRVCSTIHALRSGAEATSEMTADERATFEQDILILGEEILSRDFEGVEPARIDACDHCEFLPRCSRWFRMQEQLEAP